MDNIINVSELTPSLSLHTFESAAAHLQKGEFLDTLLVALPGYPKRDIRVEIRDGIMKVSAQTGDSLFLRSFALSDKYDEEEISAAFETGLLHIFLPFRRGIKTRRVIIR